MTDTPDEIIEHRACFCTECGKDVSGLPFELFGKRQVIDIPTIKQVVTEHRVYRCKCTCGNMIVFIHGLFMNPASWETWIKYFEEKGYKCHAPAYPFHEAEPSDLRTNINPELGKLTFGQVINSLAGFIDKLAGKPILIGHSMGGLDKWVSEFVEALKIVELES